MLFLWKTTKLGKIWIDGEEFRQIVSKRLPSGYYCQEVSFLGDQDTFNIYISVPDNVLAEEKEKLAVKFQALFIKSGIKTSVNWIHLAPQDNPSATPIWTLPVFWAGAAAALTALVKMGLAGILWSLFAAVIGYGVSWIALTEDGKKQVSSLIQHFRR